MTSKHLGKRHIWLLFSIHEERLELISYPERSVALKVNLLLIVASRHRECSLKQPR